MNSKVDYRDSFPILSTRSFTRRAAEKVWVHHQSEGSQADRSHNPAERSGKGR